MAQMTPDASFGPVFVVTAFHHSCCVCHIEFYLEHSPSVSVRLRLFPSVPRPSTLFFPTILFFSVPFRCIRTFPRPYYTSISVRLILSTFHIRIRSNLSEFQPRFILFPLLFGYNPYQPNPVALWPLVKKTYGRGCQMHGRRTQNGRIGATGYAEGNGTRKRAEMQNI